MPKKSWLFILLLFALWATNPSQDDFSRAVAKKALIDSGFQSGFAENLGSGLVQLMTTTDDYIFFSVFNVDNGIETKKTLGIFKKLFIPL